MLCIEYIYDNKSLRIHVCFLVPQLLYLYLIQSRFQCKFVIFHLNVIIFSAVLFIFSWQLRIHNWIWGLSLSNAVMDARIDEHDSDFHLYFISIFSALWLYRILTNLVPMALFFNKVSESAIRFAKFDQIMPFVIANRSIIRISLLPDVLAV